jgi:hypothetical protein
MGAAAVFFWATAAALFAAGFFIGAASPAGLVVLESCSETVSAGFVGIFGSGIRTSIYQISG